MLGRIAWFASLALVGLGCSSDGGGGGGADAMVDAMPSAACLAAADHSDLDWIQDEVFTPGCASFSACHRGTAASAGGLNLEAGMSQAAMVDIDSALAPGTKLVAPGDSANSYLMVILGQFGEDDARLDPGVGTMPFNNPLICKPKRDAIARWIDAL